MAKMTIDIKVGETLTIGSSTVRLEQKSGQRARLVIVADESTPIIIPGRHQPGTDARKSALQHP